MRVTRVLFTVGVWVAGLGACAHMREDTTVCPEYRELRCLTSVECSMDEQRGCKVCRCAPAPGVDDRPRAADQPEEPLR